MDTYWEAKHSWAVAFLLPIVLWEVAVFVTGYYPSYECAAGYDASKNACDYIDLIFGPFHSFARFIAGHDKFFTAAGTIVLAAFTAALFLSTFWLWRETRNAGRLAYDNHVSEQRPWLLLRVGGVRQIPVASNLAQVTLQWGVSNTGRAPAVGVRLFAKLHRPSIYGSREERFQAFIADRYLEYFHSAGRGEDYVFFPAYEDDLPDFPICEDEITPHPAAIAERYDLFLCLLYRPAFAKDKILFTASAHTVTLQGGDWIVGIVFNRDTVAEVRPVGLNSIT